MKIWRNLSVADTIFSRTLLLVLATVLLLTAANIAIIVFRGPPISAPLSAYEIARLLQHKAVAKPTQNITLSVIDRSPNWQTSRGVDALFAQGIASHLDLPAASIRVHRSNRGQRDDWMNSTLAREFQLYHEDDQFNPIMLGDFQVAMKQPSGYWLLLSSGSGQFQTWQIRTTLFFLLSLLMILPIAWFFSSRLSGPIRIFGEAAEKLGRRHQTEVVEAKGPVEIRRAASAMNEMQQRLTAYLAERSSMVGAIAHDLRTPLSRLRFLLAPAPDELRTKVEAEVAEMEALIAAILDFVQNEGRLGTQEPIELGLLVEGIVDDFADMHHDVLFESGAQVTVSGDPPLLRRLFANLISNAVTYGKSARVSVRAEEGWAIVDIADEGPGLRDADRDRVFLPFFRAESSRSRSTGGIGLGLAIVKAVVETHGGTVDLFNRDAGGLCARVKLPIRQIG